MIFIDDIWLWTNISHNRSINAMSWNIQFVIFHIHSPMNLNNNSQQRITHKSFFSFSKAFCVLDIQLYGLIDFFGVYRDISIIIKVTLVFAPNSHTHTRAQKNNNRNFMLCMYVWIYRVYIDNDYYRARLRTCWQQLFM